MGLRIQHDLYSVLLTRGYVLLFAHVEHAHHKPVFAANVNKTNFHTFSIARCNQPEWVGPFPLCEWTMRWLAFEINTCSSGQRPNRPYQSIRSDNVRVGCNLFANSFAVFVHDLRYCLGNKNEATVADIEHHVLFALFIYSTSSNSKVLNLALENIDFLLRFLKQRTALNPLET